MDNAVILPVPTNVTSDELRRDPVRKVSRLLVGVKFREGAN